ncbi:hypothetical protein CBW54_12665 [Yersinia kristensenii]|nr:hypothetical protein CBW54_12665 [Yersinia kristensenii]
MQRCWLHSLARITDLSQLIGTHLFAVLLHLEIYWVYWSSSFKLQRCWLHSLGYSIESWQIRPRMSKNRPWPDIAIHLKIAWFMPS